MKRFLPFALMAAFLMIPPSAPAQADTTVTWMEILQRLALAAQPGASLRDVVHPLMDRPVSLEAAFERTETDEVGRTWQRFRYDNGNITFICFSDAESAPAAPGWRGVVTGLLVAFEFQGVDPDGRRIYLLRLRRAGTDRLPDFSPPGQ